MVIKEWLLDTLSGYKCMEIQSLEIADLEKLLDVYYEETSTKEIDGKKYVIYTNEKGKELLSTLTLEEEKQVIISKTKEIETFFLANLHNNASHILGILKNCVEGVNEVEENPNIREAFTMLTTNLKAYVVDKVIINAAMTYSEIVCCPDGFESNLLQKNVKIEFYEACMKIIADMSSSTLTDYLVWFSFFSTIKCTDFLEELEDEEILHGLNLLNHETLKRILFLSALLHGREHSAFRCLQQYKNLYGNCDFEGIKNGDLSCICMPISPELGFVFIVEDFKNVTVGIGDINKLDKITTNEKATKLDAKKACSCLFKLEVPSVEGFIALVFLYFGLTIPSLVATNMKRQYQSGISEDEIINKLEASTHDEDNYDLLHGFVAKEELIKCFDSIIIKLNGGELKF